MITQTQKRAMLLAVRAGEIMMKSGAEVYRVEETISRICTAAHIQYVEVFATPTGLMVSIGSGGEQGDVNTYIKAIDTRSTDLMKISRVNSFSRKFTKSEISVEEGMKELTRIDKEKPYSLPIRTLGASLTASLFSTFFGAGLAEAIFCFFVAAASYLLSVLLNKFETNYFIQGLACTAFGCLLALTLSSVNLIDSYDSVIIGMIMIFVPGAALTNALRDLLTGDMLAGLARLTEAIIVTLSLATGTGLIIKIWSALGGLVI